jgi:putative membrane protein
MKHYLMVFIKGMAMGAADIVPGVSGGTVAFITGVYEELLDSLKKMTPASLALWYREGFASFWRHINGFFLLSLFCGILLSILSLANVVTWLLAEHPLLVWGFFFGMVLASTIYIAKPLPFRNPLIVFLFIAGVAIAVGISLIRPAQLPGEWWVVLMAGSIAICAMLLPGISGSFMLILMGLYGFILQSLVDFNLIIIISFASGCVIGLLTFSHLLSWLLRNYHDITLALMTGFLLGSLTVIWPWKHVLEMATDRHGEQIAVRHENVLPDQFFALSGNDPQTLPVLGVALFGFILVFALEYGANVYQRKLQK